MPRPPGRPRTGSVFRHGDHFDVQVTYPNGKRSPRACLEPSIGEAEARKLAKKYSDDAARAGGPVGVVAVAPAAVGETFDAWNERRCALLEAQGRQSLVRDIRSHFSKWISPRLGPRPVAAITRTELEAFVQWIDERVRAGALRAKSASNVWGTLSKAFDDASRSKLLELRVRDDNPALGVRPPDEGPVRSTTYLYPAELAALVACERVPLRWRRLFAVGAYIYARTGEIEALLWEDVDFERRVIHIHRAVDRRAGTVKATKTDQPRRIPMEPTLVPLVEAMKRDATNEHVVDMPPAHDIPRRMRQYLAWAGVTRAELFAHDDTRKRISFYDASRATGITWMAIRGDDPLRIQQRAGHSDFKTTQGYIREAENLTHDVGVPFAPLPLGILVSLRESLQGPAQWAKLREGVWKPSVPSGIRTQDDASNPAVSPAKASIADVATDATDGANYANARPQSDSRSESAAPLASLDVVEAALATALERASAAGEWAVVGQLARELEARRAAHAVVTNVVRLDKARRR